MTIDTLLYDSKCTIIHWSWMTDQDFKLMRGFVRLTAVLLLWSGTLEYSRVRIGLSSVAVRLFSHGFWARFSLLLAPNVSIFLQYAENKP